MHDDPLHPKQITGVREESPTVRTFTFTPGLTFNPGQFVMVTVPGVDEIPMGLSHNDTITVQKVGDATTALFALGPGDFIGVRGPFGNGFPVSGRILAIAGGVGAAPLRPLAMAGTVDTFLLGARTAAELLFMPELAGRTRLLAATDDGSYGHAGTVVSLIQEVVPGDFDAICVCGPERMMHAVLRTLDAAGLAGRTWLSLHRYMKCGIGVCGSCCMDPDGVRVCREGPVFRGDALLTSELGNYTRDAAGRRMPV